MINELINDLLDEKKDFLNILRKAKIIASELKIIEMKQWIKGELEGYRGIENLPDYRMQYVQSFGTFSGPFGSGVNNVALPTMDLPEEIKPYVEFYEIRESIAELIDLINTSKGKLTRKWRAEIVIVAREYIQMTGGQVLVDAEQKISKSMLAGVVENAKNKLLDFLIELKESKITISNKTTDVESQKARNIFNVSVYGNNNVVTNSEKINKQDIIVSTGDFESLNEYLKNIGLQEPEIDELKDAIIQDGKEPRKKFGDKVNIWLGKILSKISEGVITASLQVAPALIVEAINKFYGN